LVATKICALLHSLFKAAFHIAALTIAVALLAFIAYATLGPLPSRPRVENLPAVVDRFAAYFATAAAFVAAYPRRTKQISMASVAVAIVLELGQFVVPTRDPGAIDVAEKAAGGICGALTMAAIVRLALARKHRR
jgi:VanZ family protein